MRFTATLIIAPFILGCMAQTKPVQVLSEQLKSFNTGVVDFDRDINLVAESGPGTWEQLTIIVGSSVEISTKAKIVEATAGTVDRLNPNDSLLVLNATTPALGLVTTALKGLDLRNRAWAAIDNSEQVVKTMLLNQESDVIKMIDKVAGILNLDQANQLEVSEALLLQSYGFSIGLFDPEEFDIAT